MEIIKFNSKRSLKELEKYGFRHSKIMNENKLKSKYTYWENDTRIIISEIDNIVHYDCYTTNNYLLGIIYILIQEQLLIVEVQE